MILRSRSTWPVAVMCGVTTCISLHATVVAANQACGLVTVQELEAVVGSAVVMKGGAPTAGGKTEVCIGQTPNASVLLRLVTGLDPGRDRSGSKEKAGLELFKNMGAKIEVKRFGPIICSTIEPPEQMPQNFNTTCTAVKDTAVAGIEVTVKSRTGMVSIEKLHQLAEKMATRF